MKVILLKDVRGVGRRFEEKEVASGYAANFLVPQKLAVPVTDAAAREIKALKEKEEKERAGKESALEESLAHIAGTAVEIAAKANEQGHLFSKITAEKLSEMLKGKGIDIDPKFILLENPIKETGTHEVPVQIGDKETHFTLAIRA